MVIILHYPCAENRLLTGSFVPDLITIRLQGICSFHVKTCVSKLYPLGPTTCVVRSEPE
jgi:hypothetical protein